MGSSLLDQMGQLHIVRGVISGTGTATVSSNDVTCTLTDNGTGNYTLTFGDVFLSAPTVSANAVDATFAATDGAAVVSIISAATNAVVFNSIFAGDEDSNGAAGDMDIHFHIMGMRNN